MKKILLALVVIFPVPLFTYLQILGLMSDISWLLLFLIFYGSTIILLKENSKISKDILEKIGALKEMVDIIERNRNIIPINEFNSVKKILDKSWYDNFFWGTGK